MPKKRRGQVDSAFREFASGWTLEEASLFQCFFVHTQGGKVDRDHGDHDQAEYKCLVRHMEALSTPKGVRTCSSGAQLTLQNHTAKTDCEGKYSDEYGTQTETNNGVSRHLGEQIHVQVL